MVSGVRATAGTAATLCAGASLPFQWQDAAGLKHQTTTPVQGGAHAGMWQVQLYEQPSLVGHRWCVCTIGRMVQIPVRQVVVKFKPCDAAVGSRLSRWSELHLRQNGVRRRRTCSWQETWMSVDHSVEGELARGCDLGSRLNRAGRSHRP